MKYIKVGRKCLKQYELRLVGDSPNYPFYAVVAEIEMMLNREGTINVQEGSCIRNVPIRVHVFDSGKSIIPYELGHRPEELSLWDDERCINPCCDFSKNDKCGLGNSIEKAGVLAYLMDKRIRG